MFHFPVGFQIPVRNVTVRGYEHGSRDTPSYPRHEHQRCNHELLNNHAAKAFQINIVAISYGYNTSIVFACLSSLLWVVL